MSKTVMKLPPLPQGYTNLGMSTIYTASMMTAYAEQAILAEREQGQKWFDAVTSQHKQAILAEREACAKVCSEAAERALALQSGGDDLSCVIVRHHAVAHLADAAAIRSRENT